MLKESKITSNKDIITANRNNVLQKIPEGAS